VASVAGTVTVTVGRGERRKVIVLIVIVAIVALFVIGWLVVGLVFKLLWWALVGLAIGALARLILPGKQQISLLATAGAGVAAALLGGIVAHALDLGGVLQFVIAVAVAVGLIAALAGSRLARA
jgi:uncharacterized membrane protein YeaQ/YmgE (transglycosylase-associated protein family)